MDGKKIKITITHEIEVRAIDKALKFKLPSGKMIRLSPNEPLYVGNGEGTLYIFGDENVVITNKNAETENGNSAYVLPRFAVVTGL